MRKDEKKKAEVKVEAKVEVKFKAKMAQIDLALLPVYCDFSCAYASFPPADAVGACRREQGVYCNFMGRYNNKNAGCLVRRGTLRQ